MHALYNSYLYFISRTPTNQKQKQPASQASKQHKQASKKQISLPRTQAVRRSVVVMRPQGAPRGVECA